PAPATAAGDRHALPLAGVRVADITVVWAGPHVTQLLGEWGADVVRVEPVNRIQPYSRGAERIMPREQAKRLAAAGVAAAGTPGYPDDDPGDDPWNRAASFNSHARNKRSMACDVMSPEGREAFLRLIEHCDVFVENNVPATIERAGLTYEQLRERNPRIIVLRMPAFGLSGPYKNYRGFGTHVEGMIGHHYLRGYRDLTPEATGEAFTADAMAGVMGALAVTMALRHRDRTGLGQQIEMPLAEAFLPVLGQPILDYTMNDRVTPPQGNSHPWRAPHGIYPCAGDDQWIAIDVGSDIGFGALCRVLGADALAVDPRFATVDGRREHAVALDAGVGARTVRQDKEALFHALQAAGVIAAPVHDELEALADPQLNARGFFEQLDGPSTGNQRYPGLLFRMRDTPNHLRTPPVRLGEHNEEIYLDLLGYARDEYDALIARGLVGTTYSRELIPEAGS
ncbi:MAG: CoA transferase, partial [Chloroflexi bacterium]|nr:CoA transferase [Chloroflexota bacterium]